MGFYGILWDNYTLAGGLNPFEKYEFVNWDDYSQYMGKSKIFHTTNQTNLVGIPLIMSTASYG